MFLKYIIKKFLNKFKELFILWITVYYNIINSLIDGGQYVVHPGPVEFTLEELRLIYSDVKYWAHKSGNIKGELNILTKIRSTLKEAPGGIDYIEDLLADEEVFPK